MSPIVHFWIFDFTSLSTVKISVEFVEYGPSYLDHIQ